jgi:nitrite reductase (NADH) large subunit
MARKYRCTVCGYEHEGDGPPDQCPVCGVDREMFELVEAPAAEPAAKPASTPRPAATSSPGWVILGGGIAALSAATAARESDAKTPIVLVHREPTLPYHRLSLTRMLAGEIASDGLVIHPAAWFAERRIDLVCAEARRIDRQGHTVLLDDGRSLHYERLLVATGAHAFVPPIPGVLRAGVHVLRTLGDADAILARSVPGTRVVCIGAGLLGLETAGGLARRGIEVTVLENGERLLPRQLANSASDRLTAYLGSLGIHFRFRVESREIAGDESVRGVVLADRSDLPADLVVIAAGVRPNADLPRAAGLTVGRGLVVDDGMRTSDPDVFAAGDVTEHHGVTWGLWTVALEQGTLAGQALAGKSVVFEGKPAATQLKVVGLPVFSVGRFDPAAPDESVIERADEKHLVRIVTKSDVVVGGNLVGDVSLAGELRRAVHEGLDVRALRV